MHEKKMSRMKLSSLFIKGFKSIDGKQGQQIPLGDVTVLLGANGAGKSNLVSFFKMLNYMTTGALQQFVGKQGASRLLHRGAKYSEAIDFCLNFASEEADDSYEVRLEYGLPDRLYFSKEAVRYHRADKPEPLEYQLASGGSESSLKDDVRQTSRVVFGLLSGIRTYQFHDTSETAKIKDRGYIDDTNYLRSDAGNLAAFLKMLKEQPNYSKYYQRIVRRVQRAMPQFGDFELTAIAGNDNYVRLNWRDNTGDDYLYDPHQISDGSLRFMALVALLLQPPELLPKFIVLDEPELGLHPAAIAELAGMVRAASQKCQILLATQSTRLVDEFAPEQIVIVEHEPDTNRSVFKTLDQEQLRDWLGRYSMSELWEKHVLGGQP